MPFDGAFLNSVINELNSTVLGARIEKILQPGTDEIILQLHTNTGSARLLLSSSPSNPRIQLTNIPKKNPDVPPPFCMLLRKHITGGRIVDVAQRDFDRIAEITIQTKNDLQDITHKKLIIEMMGKYSNIILTDSDYKIFDCAKRVSGDMSSVRELFPGLTYEKPPQSGKRDPRLCIQEELPLDDGSFSESFFSDSFCGISIPTGRELMLYARKTDSNPLGLFFEKINSSKPVTYTNAKGKNDMLPYKYESVDSDFREWDSPSELLDSFYALCDSENKLRQYTSNITKVLHNNIIRAEKKKALLEKELDDVKDNDKNRLYGELLTANIYMLSKGMEKVTVQNYYCDDLPEIEIPLRKELTPSENIQRYYKRYTKGKNAYAEITKQLAETEAETEYLRSQLYNTQFCTEFDEIDEIASELEKLGYVKHKAKQKDNKNNKNKAATAPQHFVTSAGRDVYVGKNNKQNEYLTHRMAADDDIWLHAKNIAASHVILKCAGKMPEQCITEAAVLAAYNSSARGATKIPVDYCFKKNVRKPSGAKPGYVIYDNYYTIVVDGTQEAVNKIIHGENNDEKVFR